MANAIIEGDTATLELEVKIPKHYLEFFNNHLKKNFGFEDGYLEEVATIGILMDINEKYEALHEAIQTGDVEIKPDLSLDIKVIKEAEKEIPEGKSEKAKLVER